MTLSNREWEMLQAIDKRTEAMNTRFVLIESQVIQWQKREKWLFRLAVATAVGLCVWFVKGQFHF